MARAPDAGAAAAISARRRWLVLLVTAGGSFMAIVDTFIVNVGIPSIRTSLHPTSGEIEFVITAYTLTYAVLLITGARLGDIVGRKELFLGGMLVFTLASLACGCAPTPAFLIGARVVQAAGAAMMTPQVISTVQVTFSGRDRALALSLLSAMNGIAATTAQLVGGVLIQADILGLGWRVIFLLNLPIGIVVATAAALIQPRQPPSHRSRLDISGAALLMGTLLLVLVPLVEGRDAGWPAWMLGMLAFAAPAFAAFVAHQLWRTRRGATPLVTAGLFRERSFSIGLLILLLVGMANTSLFFTMTLYLQSGLGFTPERAGLTFTPLGLGFLLGSFLAPRVLRRAGRGALLLAYGLIAVGALLLMLRVHGAAQAPSPTSLALALAVIALGQGIGTSSLFGTILSRARRSQTGSASGMMTTTMQLGGALGVAAVGLVFFSVLGARDGINGYGDAFSAALCIQMALAVAAMSVVPFLPRGATAFASEQDARVTPTLTPEVPQPAT